MPSYKNAEEAKKAMSGASMTKKQKQRKLKRGKRREERRKYGWNKKNRAENKADARAKAKALAQAAIVGGDHQAGGKDGTGGNVAFDFSESGKTGGKNMEVKEVSLTEGISMKSSKHYNRKGGASMNGITPGGKKDRNNNPVKRLVGENTSEIKKDKKGRDYSLILENDNNFFKGDTIRPANAPRVANFMMGGDYKVTENKDSKKRPTDVPRSFTVKSGPSMKSNQSGGGYAAKKPSAPAKQLMRNQKDGGSMYGKKHGASMNAYQDKEASMDDYSHEKKLKADGRYEAAHGKMANAKNDFNHAHALKKDAHSDARGRISILKHMKKF